MGFYKSFLNLSKTKQEKIYNIQKSIEGAIDFSSKCINYIIRPQILYKDHKDYYIAYDTLKKVKYICFRELLTIDIDINGSYILIDSFIINYFNSFKDECFSIHKTRNGYHVFVLSRAFDYKTKESVKFMLENLCDFYYCCYSNVRGYSVRLSKKDNESTPIYTYLGIFGNKSLIKQNLLDLSELILSIID